MHHLAGVVCWQRLQTKPRKYKASNKTKVPLAPLHKQLLPSVTFSDFIFICSNDAIREVHRIFSLLLKELGWVVAQSKWDGLQPVNSSRLRSVRSIASSSGRASPCMRFLEAMTYKQAKKNCCNEQFLMGGRGITSIMRKTRVVTLARVSSKMFGPQRKCRRK